jgi:hypothetical protein
MLWILQALFCLALLHAFFRAIPNRGRVARRWLRATGWVAGLWLRLGRRIVRTRAGRLLVATRVGRRIGSTRAGRRIGPLLLIPPQREPDPFEALHVQTRLSAVAEEVRLLTGDCEVYAPAERLKARRQAYDRLLEDACVLAGVPTSPQAPRQDAERLRREVELVARGWSW